MEADAEDSSEFTDTEDSEEFTLLFRAEELIWRAHGEHATPLFRLGLNVKADESNGKVDLPEYPWPGKYEDPWYTDQGMHRHVICDVCGASPIVGLRFKCMDCPDFDLCGDCHKTADQLHPKHTFELKDASSSVCSPSASVLECTSNVNDAEGSESRHTSASIFTSEDEEERRKHRGLLRSLIGRLLDSVLILEYIDHEALGQHCVAIVNGGVLSAHSIDICQDRIDELTRIFSRCAVARSKWEEVSQSVSQSLLGPVDALIEQYSWIHIIAVGSLSKVQYHALPWRETPLICQRRVSYANSLTEMVLQRSVGAGKHSAAQHEANNSHDSRARIREKGTVSVILSGPVDARTSERPDCNVASIDLPDLRCAVAEGNCVSQQLAETYDIYKLEGSEVGYEQACGLHDRLIMQGALAEVFHIASHFFFPDDPRLKPELRLSNGQNVPVPHINDVIPDRVKLCFLSACATGLISAGICANLVASVMAGKGCQYIVTTSWSISDFAGLVFANMFYAEFAKHPQDPVGACQTAQKALWAMKMDELKTRAQETVEHSVCCPRPTKVAGVSDRPQIAETNDSWQSRHQADDMQASLLCGIEEEIPVERGRAGASPLSPFWWASHRVYCNPTRPEAACKRPSARG